ncbi:hypothetical protein [Flavobacterium soyangense]|uniref:Uncharacterized protein n=1 Tax=Flavobacterium soyangense TaxID=2023265 RepID=A0A930XUJ7_9FLAO|nr:hypothetical protein [Flavobacterium soyangense]MBF2707087.1 hypothetical protein [Flavobacterium soyangense]
MKLVGVECWADKYFFGRLLNDKNIIRKESGDDAVIDGVAIRSKGSFSVGIVDVDKDKKIPKDFTKICENENTQIFKHNENCQFIILIGPRQFEHWINEYLKIKNSSVEDFGFVNFVEFMKQSKSLKPENDERFKDVISFVIENFHRSENHIFKLKIHLEYILEKKYQFNIEEFQNI